jgi:hypothetical protein
MLAGFFGGFQAPPQSVVDLLLARRNNRLAEQFPHSLIPVPGTQAYVLPGPRSHAQARSAEDLWEPLSLIWSTLGCEGTDVLIDAGRLAMESYPDVLLSLVDLVLLVTRSDLPSLAGAKQWTDLAHETRDLHPETPPWGVLLVGSGNPYSSKEVLDVLGLPVVSTLTLDAKGAKVFSEGTRVKGRTRLSRSLTSCVTEIHTFISSQLLTAGAS